VLLLSLIPKPLEAVEVLTFRWLALKVDLADWSVQVHRQLSKMG
jgi:hypothetical protein